MRRRLHLRELAVRAIGKSELLDGCLDGHVSTAQKAACEGMTPHEEQMEDQDGETEVVVVGRPNNSTKRPPLQFRWGEGGDTNLAEVILALDSNLKAVAVDQSHCCVLRNRDAAVVDVSNDTMILMDHGKGTSNVGCNAQKKSKVCRGKFCFSALGAVEFVDVLAARNFRHQETVRSVAVRHDNTGRPGRGSL